MNKFSVVGDYSAALFDMDGTLVDSTALVESEWEEWARRKGLEPLEVAHHSHGRRTEDVISKYFPNSDVLLELAAFREMAAQLDQSTVKAIPGALDFVLSIKTLKWAVVTSAPQGIARRRLKVCGFPLPEVLVSADDVVCGKPDPEGFLKAGEALRAMPHDCVAFEDAPAGVAAALAARMQVVALRTTHPTDVFAGCVRVNDFTDLRTELLSLGMFRLAFSN